VQAQVLELLAELRRARALAVLFVSHDLAVVRAVAERVAVLLAGRVVEEAGAAELFARPRHPYTRALVEALPALERAAPTPALALAPLDEGPGCAFAPRCARADARCRAERPALLALEGRQVACHAPEP
jgi:peptide/nickel transport system ATP-binding protein